jgi:2,3,4,5-tetrahydropyridine-2-carboxylate N-succinyltransferase
MTISVNGHSFIDTDTGKTLDAWFPDDGTEPFRACLAEKFGLVKGQTITLEIESLEDPPINATDVYYRLHLLSQRQQRPNSVNLENIFGLLNNVAWTSAGPVTPENVSKLRTNMAKEGQSLAITSVDKFPRMTDYVVPSGVRICDADRVRLGAHLAEGTTVMHAGFVNFNAGTLGTSMVEGRISAGVVVGNNSDLGGGCSIMGSLSGGGKEANITVGEQCLIGANAGIGISLGDGCIVESGLYVTAGTVVTLPDGSTKKARDLTGQPGLLYRRNSKSGVVEALSAGNIEWAGLNEVLHKGQ